MYAIAVSETSWNCQPIIHHIIAVCNIQIITIVGIISQQRELEVIYVNDR